MSAGSDPVLFEAVSSPPQSLTRRGMCWLCAIAPLGAAVPAGLFTLLGAWPVLGFMGAEVLLLLGMVATHRRWSAAATETVMLTAGRLTVMRSNGRGGRERAELEPYWTRLDMEERAGIAPVLRLVERGRAVEIGRFLSEAEKRQLAVALEAALRRYRQPVFDNPQLRDD